MKSLLRLTALAAFSLSLTAPAAHWPLWRGGPDGSGITTDRKLPVQWSESANVKWRVDLPERGNSTPVIWGDRIFVTQPLENEQKRTLLCFRRADGHQLWQATVEWTKPERTHKTNPYCSPSPATDGQRVVAAYGPAGVFCYDMDGKELWRRELGPQDHEWGYSSSPVIAGNLCYLYHGPGEAGKLVALDLQTGKVVWQFDEPKWDTAGRTDGFQGRNDGITGSFSTPILVQTGKRAELVMSFPQQLIAFDPRTGKKLWWCDGLNPLIYTSPIAADGIVVAMGGYNGNSIAVKAGGTGDVTPQRLWQHVRGKGGIGTGVIKDGHIYYFASGNVATCLELETGRVIYEERVKISGARSDTWASMTLAGDLIYMPNQSGDVVILKASPRFEQIGVNTVKEMSNSSLAIADGDIVFRTHKSLWCFREQKQTAAR
jgi:outer membrane protein assembly factor BamB